MEYTVIEFGNEYLCRRFYNTDNNSGVDVSLNGNHIGSIIGLEIPDESDAIECTKFENDVTDWIVENS
jgi:hypothetical protein